MPKPPPRDRGALLRELYDEAISLAARQATAIANDRWDELSELLSERDKCLEEAERLLRQLPLPTNRTVLSERLQRLQALDQTNQQAIEAKRATLLAEIRDLDRSKLALSGYLEALGDPVDPRFFDQDQ